MSFSSLAQLTEDRATCNWDVNMEILETNQPIYSSKFYSSIDDKITWRMKIVKYENTIMRPTIVISICNESGIAIMALMELNLVDSSEVSVLENSSDWMLLNPKGSPRSECAGTTCKYESIQKYLRRSGYEIKIRTTVRVMLNMKEERSGMLLKDIERLWMTKEHADVVFSVGGGKIQAHKAVLSARCKVLGDILVDKDQVEMKDVSAEVFEEFLRYIYTEEVSLGLMVDEVQLCKLAYDTDMPQLRDQCEEYLSDNLSNYNYLEVMQLAESCSRQTLKESVIEFITNNLVDVEEGADWTIFIRDFPEAVLSIISKASKVR